MVHWRLAQLDSVSKIASSVEGVMRASLQEFLVEILGSSMTGNVFITSRKLQPQLDSGYGDPSPKSSVEMVVFKNHHRLDSQICCLDKLCDVLDLSSLTLNLSNLWLCTRIPMVRSVAVGRLRSSSL